MSIDRRLFAESLMVRLGMALGAIVFLALAATISATVFAELSTGKASAINLAGSLRMQSYWIALQVLRADERAQAREGLGQAVAEYEARLHELWSTGGIPRKGEDATRRAYDRVATAWWGTLRAAVDEAFSGGVPARDGLVARMADHVRDVDALVSLIEDDLERRIRTLRLIQGIALLAITAVMFVALYLMHSSVIVPLGNLLECARRVRVGDFSVRAQHAGEDELGQLGQSFNYMVSDLARSYATLEAKVSEKTEQLARSNVSLEVLYNTTRTLAESPLTQSTLDAVTRDIERVTGLEAAAICAREEGDRRGFPIVLGMEGGSGIDGECGGGCDEARCYDCFAEGEARARMLCSGAGRMLAVPLSEGGKRYGVMLLRVPPDREVDAWKLQLLESIGHHIGAALAAAKRSDERRRMALMEERSVIARELHDSLAQSLSYLKIQVTRLKSCLERDGPQVRTADVVEELKAGLNNAYRQLRELLTTFRLRMDGRGLAETLRETVGEFRRRTEVDFRLNDRLLGHELDASEQIHVLQVVREALTNVEHHARARHADVHLSTDRGRVRVTVEDDGVGIEESEPPAHHYGLAIMRDRAATLGGALSVSRRAGGGTRVELEFTPRGPFRAGTPPPTVTV